MSSMAGAGVGGLLGHKVCSSRLKFSLERFLFLFTRWFLFSSGSYSYPCMRPQSQQQFDQCDQRGRGTWARVQSKPTLAKSILKQVRQRAAPTFQSGFNFSLNVVSFLFPSNCIN